MYKLTQKYNRHISAFKSHKNYLLSKKDHFSAQIQLFANDQINADHFTAQIKLY